MLKVAGVLDRLIARRPLEEGEARAVLKEILAGTIPPTQTAALLALLRAKGETAGEIAGFVRAMRESMVRLEHRRPVLADTCGTGGDGKQSFNISTAAAFVVAGAGVPVAKHGNRSISSRSGSADVLEALGVKADMPKATAELCLERIGITFLFAPLYHPAMRHVGPVRKELGIRTVFNFMGPLLNPAGANAQVIGVPETSLLPLLARVLARVEDRPDYRALLLHEAGYDEVALIGRASVVEVRGGRARAYALSPADFGLRKGNAEALNGGDSRRNARILRDVLEGKAGPLSDAIVANAALSIACARSLEKGAKPVESALRECARLARESIASGAALRKLDGLVRLSRGEPEA